MTSKLQRLIGLRHAESDKAASLQRHVLNVQIAVALIAGATVYLANDRLAYAAAVLTVVFSITWAVTLWQFRNCRAQSERARRATLLMTGLGAEMSNAERASLEATFTVTASQGKNCENPSYYASQVQPGPERLTEILEESVFWSAHLMRYSARRTWWWFAGSIIFAMIVLVGALPIFGTEEVLSGVRVGCALLVFLISADVIGAALAYTSSANLLENMRSSLERIRAEEFPLYDLILILCDYNSAVEGAPMFVPGAYKRNKDLLNQIWARAHPPTKIH